MYTINNTINLSHFNGLKVSKLLDIDIKEVLLISLERAAVFPTHSSPTNVHLLMLEGVVKFFIDGKEFILKKYQIFDFPKHKEHWVKAQENSKFLIIR